MLGNLSYRIKRLFRPKSSKRIFAYHDGIKWRTADPIEILHKIDTHPKYLAQKHYPLVCEGNREAIEITAAAVCDVFGVVPYLDGKGLTIGERIALLDAFDAYCSWVKKNTNPTVIPAPSTE